MLSKKELYTFTRRTYRFLKEHPEKLDLQKIRKKYGLKQPPCAVCDKETKEIIIDYRHTLLGGLVHELLHVFHPEWSETTVLKMESAIINQLSTAQVKHLIKAFAEIL